MFIYIYVSSATVPFERADLLALLERSRTRNTARGITGMLLYKDGNFMQALEGEEQTVRELVRRIRRDPRHKGFLTLLEDYEEERLFPDWSMGFRDLDAPEIVKLPGYSEFLNTPLTGDEFSGDPKRAHKLLLTFKRRM